uniref:Zinc ribbon domain containing 2 n=1 Tax=Poecilia reticulata TaxID=8081 RepID=A0A3P9NMS2_POERE
MALNGDEEDFEWEPPTEAEMKVIQARRERQDKISKLMGDYLLKGYKMLGDCCEACGVSRTGPDFKSCVMRGDWIWNVSSDISPALTSSAKISFSRSSVSSQAGVSVPQPRPEHCEGAAAGGRALLPPPVVASTLQPALEEAEEAVLTKLRWATTQLQSSASLEASIQLCSLIGSCANSLRSLRELSQ